MDKIKLLIVTESLAQGGSEKWIYEICKSIDKKKFEIGILTDKNYLSTDKTRNFKNYHYYELKNLGVKIYEYLDFNVSKTRLGFTLYRAKRLVRHLLGKTKTKIIKEVIDLLQIYDVVCVLDFYNYITLKEVIHKYCEGRFFIVLHSHKIQFDYDPYAIFDKDKQYNFTYFCPKQVEQIKSSGIDAKRNNFFFNPLVLDLSGYEHIFNPITDEPIIISVFSRIISTRQLEPFIEAFAGIQQNLSHKSALNIYGEILDINYYQSLQALIKSLNIEDGSVRFMGHTQDIAGSIKTDKVNIYWGHTNNSTLGYSSIEIGSTGLPSFFWSYEETTGFRDILEETEHDNMDDFVAANLKYLSNNELLRELSIKQRSFFISKHDITGKIKDFENYVASFSKVKERNL